jgi:hypothetical protein
MMKRMLAAAALAAVWAGPASATEPWVGRWTIDPAGCTSYGDTASTSPLIVSDTSLRWFVSSCRIGKMYKTGQDAHIEAHCSAEGKSETFPISLKPRGDKMTVIWHNTPAGEMRRCK